MTPEVDLWPPYAHIHTLALVQQPQHLYPRVYAHIHPYTYRKKKKAVIQVLSQEDRCKFKASVDYIVSTRQARLQQDPIPKHKSKAKQTQSLDMAGYTCFPSTWAAEVCHNFETSLGHAGHISKTNKRPQTDKYSRLMLAH